jgi:hypothetical protein
MMASRQVVLGSLLIAVLIGLACNLPGSVSPSAPATAPPRQAPDASAAPPTQPLPASTAEVVHTTRSPTSVPAGKLIHDVVSQDTAPEKRAPYGDSYDINRLERPFQQDMGYLPNLDIASFTVSSDTDWWFVSMELVGGDPNDPLGINYGVELDLDHDGFGDYLVWGNPPYPSTWDTAPVEIYQDKNHDTGGLSAEKSDAPIAADGYETLIFSGGRGDPDPDQAWVRTMAGSQATVQFAFKKSWSGTVFMLGVLSDAGLRDPAGLDYVDRFTIAEAGSPVRGNDNYPLRALNAVDNHCREAFGFSATGYEPQLCPRVEPTTKPRAATPEPQGCPDPGNCPYGWAGEPDCYCIPG